MQELIETVATAQDLYNVPLSTFIMPKVDDPEGPLLFEERGHSIVARVWGLIFFHIHTQRVVLMP